MLNKKFVFVVLIFSLSLYVINSSLIFAQDQDSLPGWIKNNAKWWADGVISDNEFIKSLQYLIEQKILIVPDNDKQPSMPSLIITTDKTTYKIDEPVHFTLENIGTETLIFPTTRYGIEIRTSDGIQICCLTPEGSSQLTPGEQFKMEWEQGSFYSDQVESGDYIIMTTYFSEIHNNKFQASKQIRIYE